MTRTKVKSRFTSEQINRQYYFLALVLAGFSKQSARKLAGVK